MQLFQNQTALFRATIISKKRMIFVCVYATLSIQIPYTKGSKHQTLYMISKKLPDFISMGPNKHIIQFNMFVNLGFII